MSSKGAKQKEKAESAKDAVGGAGSVTADVSSHFAFSSSSAAPTPSSPMSGVRIPPSALLAALGGYDVSRLMGYPSSGIAATSSGGLGHFGGMHQQLGLGLGLGLGFYGTALPAVTNTDLLKNINTERSLAAKREALLRAAAGNNTSSNMASTMTTGSNVNNGSSISSTTSSKAERDATIIALAARAREAELIATRAQLEAAIANQQLEQIRTSSSSAAATCTYNLGQQLAHRIAQSQYQPQLSSLFSPTNDAARVPSPSSTTSLKIDDNNKLVLGKPISDDATKRKVVESPSHFTGKSSKKTKVVYPDDAPRRPLSAYNFFFSEEREIILEGLGGKGGNVGEQKESEATTAAEAAKDDDSKPMPKKNGEASDTPIDIKGSKDEMEIELSDAAYRILMRQRTAQTKKRRPHRKTHGKISFKELAKTIGSRWRSLPSDRVAHYRKLAELDLQRYRTQMFEYNCERAQKGLAPISGGT